MKKLIFLLIIAVFAACGSSQYAMKERHNAKIDLVKEDFTISEQVESEVVIVKVLGITRAKYIPVALPPDTTKTNLEQATIEAIEEAQEPQEDEIEMEIAIFDEVDSTYFTLSGDEFVARHKIKKQKKTKVKKPTVKKPKVKKQPTEERIEIKADIFSVPVIGSAVDNRTANYALYVMMLENEGYEVVFYPQYEIKKSGFLFFYNKTHIKAKARLGKLTE